MAVDFMSILSQGAADSQERKLETFAGMQTMLQAKASAQSMAAMNKGAGVRSRGQGPIVSGGNDRGGNTGGNSGGGSGSPSRGGGSGSFAWPIKGGVSADDMRGDFGPRVHPVHGGYSNHTGVDISGAHGTPIYAVADGRVVKAAWDDIYGNQLILGHGKGFKTMYGHNSKLIVNRGDRVRAGDVIGYMGTTGLSTGDHLHLETWIKNNPVDPYKMFFGGLDIPGYNFDIAHMIKRGGKKRRK